ncbi:MAG: peptidylprolyl isomerase [Bdellovibrionales bacterium]|nr:peptidylprolyl isomerase [Bdellovibrionales bacterium]
MNSCKNVSINVAKILLGVILFLPINSQGKIIERVLSIVNSQPVLLSDKIRLEKKITNEGLIDDTLLQIYDKQNLSTDSSVQINYLIDEKILDNEIKKQSLDVTIERVELEIRNILRNKRMNYAQLKDLLKEKGASLSDYQAFIKSSLERQSLIEKEVTSKIKISDEDVAAYFLSQKGPQKNQIYEYQVSHILFLSSNGGEGEARNRAEKGLLKIKEGQSFDKVAEQYSEDPNFSQGGLLGNFRTGEMRKEIENAISSLDPGQTSALVKSSIGFQIFKVLKKTASIDPLLEQKKEEYRSKLFTEAFRRQFNNWLIQKRSDAFIRINEFKDS